MYTLASLTARPVGFLSSISPSFNLSTSSLVMARQKLAPRRIIAKRSQHRPLLQASISLLQTPPTEIFSSPVQVRGEILRILPNRPSSEITHTHIVLLPGNPGIIEYYRPFLRRLHQRLPADTRDLVSFHALGLPGHDLLQLNGLREFNIEDHIQYCVAYLQSNFVLPPVAESRVVIMGHSYGSFLGLRVLDRINLLEKAGFVMIMPALYHVAKCAGTWAQFMVKDWWRSTTWTAWMMTAMTPPALRDGIVGRMKHDAGVESVTKRLVDGTRKGLYMNICSLARDEMKSITDPKENFDSRLSELAKRSLFVWTEGDKWCPPDARKKIRSVFGDRLQEEQTAEGVSHAFPLLGDDMENVAKLVAYWTCDWLRSLPESDSTQVNRG